MNKHEPKPHNVKGLFTQICKYCGRDIVFDSLSREFVSYFMFEECISDDEKIIKDLLE
jgi:hypothetical protein